MDQAPSWVDPTHSDATAKCFGSDGIYTLTLSVADFEGSSDLCNKGLVATAKRLVRLQFA